MGSEGMDLEIVMTREAYDCLEKLIPQQVSESMKAPMFLQPSGTTPHQVVLTCYLGLADRLLTLAQPTCGAAAEAIRIAIEEHKKGGERST